MLSRSAGCRDVAARVLLGCNKQLASANGLSRCQLQANNKASLRRRCMSISSSSSSQLATHDVPNNEPILDYLTSADTAHRRELEQELKHFQEHLQEIPIVIGGKKYHTNEVKYQRIPFDHHEKVSQFYYANNELILKAADCAFEARKDWDLVPVARRLELFERAASLVSGKYRAKLNAATMLGQAKTVQQAELDSAAELADFFRFNAHFMRQLMDIQPKSTDTETNSTEFRALDGFVAAISPFNFTAIGGNLASSPVMMGNCVVWKPSDTAMLSNYLVFKLLQEAGFPDGVINFVPSKGYDFGRAITSRPTLAGINFTGSLRTFRWLWSEVGLNIRRYNSFPRLVGECGGKNFHLVHESANLDTVVSQTIRSAFEYSGQKCSACSRLYVPANLWPQIRDQMVCIAKEKLKLGPATDYATYLSAVIDNVAYRRIKDYIDYAKDNPNDNLTIICGGDTNDEVGYYISPTIIETKNPYDRLMMDELFGPVLTVYVYPEVEPIDKVLEIIDENPFALTGAIFAQDESFIQYARDKLRLSAGNLYINDKSTGSVVGQQPFGGARLSGTNDKAGSMHYLMRWANQLTVKRTTKKLVNY